MKKYLKEVLILLLQLFMFYIFPLFAGPTDTIGMVALIMISVFILSIIMIIISREKIKYSYPLVVVLSFIPSIFIYYNVSALIHSVWYLIISSVGVFIGVFVKDIFKIK